MRALLLAAFGISLVPPAAIADGLNLAGSLGRCTRSSDQSQFVITFYPGGGVGGGELQNREVSLYWSCFGKMESTSMTQEDLHAPYTLYERVSG